MEKGEQTYQVVKRSVLYIVGVGVLLALIFQLQSVLLLFLAAIIFATQLFHGWKSIKYRERLAQF